MIDKYVEVTLEYRGEIIWEGKFLNAPTLDELKEAVDTERSCNLADRAIIMAVLNTDDYFILGRPAESQELTTNVNFNVCKLSFRQAPFEITMRKRDLTQPFIHSNKGRTYFSTHIYADQVN